MLAWHLFWGTLQRLNRGSIEGKLLMLRWKGEEQMFHTKISGVCMCVHQYRHVFEHVCVCCGMCEITDIEDPWGNPLPESFILQAEKLWRKHFIPLKLQALKYERLIDSSVQAELTPSFSLNVLPLWGWTKLDGRVCTHIFAHLLYKCSFYLWDVLPLR